MKTRTIINTFAWAFRRVSKLEIEGRENVPREGAAIVVVNHLGFLDVPLGYVALDRDDATGWVADKHQRIGLYRYVVETADGVWLNRENPDLSSIKEALSLIKQGRLFAVAPEGTRSATDALIEGKEGVAYLAIQSGVPVIPAAITGTENVVQSWKRFKRPVLNMRFGQPFRMAAPDRAHRQEQMKAGILEIMCQIAALMPDKYHGVYAGEPRIREIQAQLP
jgi:1-acyl-sn-glycerol-3-phosphate acyltransferase